MVHKFAYKKITGTVMHSNRGPGYYESRTAIALRRTLNCNGTENKDIKIQSIIIRMANNS